MEVSGYLTAREVREIANKANQDELLRRAQWMQKMIVHQSSIGHLCGTMNVSALNEMVIEGLMRHAVRFGYIACLVEESEDMPRHLHISWN